MKDALNTRLAFAAFGYKSNKSDRFLHSSLDRQIREQQRAHNKHACGRSGLTARLQRAFPLWSKYVKRKTIRSHSWRRLRLQLSFVVRRSSRSGPTKTSSDKTDEQNPAAKHSSLCSQGSWPGTGATFLFIFFILGGEGSEEERRAAGCVPVLPPVVSRITTLHAQGSEQALI